MAGEMAVRRGHRGGVGQMQQAGEFPGAVPVPLTRGKWVRLSFWVGEADRRLRRSFLVQVRKRAAARGETDCVFCGAGIQPGELYGASNNHLQEACSDCVRTFADFMRG